MCSGSVLPPELTLYSKSCWLSQTLLPAALLLVLQWGLLLWWHQLSRGMLQLPPIMLLMAFLVGCLMLAVVLCIICLSQPNYHVQVCSCIISSKGQAGYQLHISQLIVIDRIGLGCEVIGTVSRIKDTFIADTDECIICTVF